MEPELKVREKHTVFTLFEKTNVGTGVGVDDFRVVTFKTRVF
jgi:hypothetical protein